MGLLPLIAADLGVSIPSAGLLISAYAMGVLIGAPLMILTTARVPRRTLLVCLMAIFTLGNLLSALAASAKHAGRSSCIGPARASADTCWPSAMVTSVCADLTVRAARSGNCLGA